MRTRFFPGATRDTVDLPTPRVELFDSFPDWTSRVALNKTDNKLAQARAAFRAQCEEAGVRRVWEKFSGRIALVLAGGGARGAYQAGALLAFQDAGVPT